MHGDDRCKAAQIKTMVVLRLYGLPTPFQIDTTRAVCTFLQYHKNTDVKY